MGVRANWTQYFVVFDIYSFYFCLKRVFVFLKSYRIWVFFYCFAKTLLVLVFLLKFIALILLLCVWNNWPLFLSVDSYFLNDSLIAGNRIIYLRLRNIRKSAKHLHTFESSFQHIPCCNLLHQLYHNVHKYRRNSIHHSAAYLILPFK